MVKMSEPTVSIVIPIYNVEKYLRSCLTSVQRQIMGDFEAILVNDCTPDNSMVIAEEFAAEDPRFIIINHEVNKDLGGARNTGIQNAQGEYILFLDSDDHLPIDALYLLVEKARETNSDQVFGDMFWMRSGILNPVLYIHTRLQAWAALNKPNLRKLPATWYMGGNVANRIYRTDLLHAHDLTFLEHVKFEDLPFSVAVWFFSQRISYVPNCVHFRTKREDPDNPSKTQDYDKRSFLDRDIVARKIYDFARDFGSDQNDLSDLAKVTLSRMLGTTQEILPLAKDEIREEMMSEWYPAHLDRIEMMLADLN